MIGFLIGFPLIIAIALFVIRAEAARDVLVVGGAIIIAIASIAMVVMHLGDGYVPIEMSESTTALLNHVSTAIGVIVVAVIVYFAVRFKNIWAGALAIVQLVLSLVFDFGYAETIEAAGYLYYDQLTLLMTFIIGVVGSGICVYALGYMKDFQKHEPEGAKDRRPFFFAIMFMFLSFMFVIVYSDDLIWLYTGWEVTTVSSFLLIGYTRTEEAMRNAFRQIIMNLLGGIAFVVALFCCVLQVGTLSLNEFLVTGVLNPAITTLAVTALAFAGLTKAAQMPFHTWLLGAMVAPTPTSALLHSSTMVKAGVFLLVKLAPVLAVSAAPSTMVILIGGLTFLLCSCMAISQSNAKRVLAYSTIANLGLITACAGVGTPEAVWAASFLILFHAIAKSLLFLCVGTAEHHIGSRNIEDMDLLFERMPRLARFMMLGIMCMFIAPFGMLLAKWATLVSFVDNNQIALILLLAFGSAATFMFWAKWMGKLAGIAGQPQNVEVTVHKSEWAAMLTMVILIIIACVGLPIISQMVVEPYVSTVYLFGGRDISSDNLWLSAILSAIVILVLFVGLERSSKAKKVNAYMAGISADNAARTYRNSLSGTSEASARNWYMEEYFGESRLTTPAHIATAVIIIVDFAYAIAALFM